MKYQKGNALVLVLIGVGLFAALSYAFTMSGRGNHSIDDDKAYLYAGQIINYMAAIKAEVTQLRMVDEIDLYDINFGNDHTNWSNTGAVGVVRPDNSNCSTPECSVFVERGGNLTSASFKDAASLAIPLGNNHPIPGEVHFFNNFIEDVGTNSEPEILLTVTGLRDEVCEAINKKLGVQSPFAQAGNDYQHVGSRTYFTKYADYSTRLPDSASGFIGKKAFCINFSHEYYGNVFYYAVSPE